MILSLWAEPESHGTPETEHLKPNDHRRHGTGLHWHWILVPCTSASARPASRSKWHAGCGDQLSRIAFARQAATGRAGALGHRSARVRRPPRPLQGKAGGFMTTVHLHHAAGNRTGTGCEGIGRDDLIGASASTRRGGAGPTRRGGPHPDRVTQSRTKAEVMQILATLASPPGAVYDTLEIGRIPPCRSAR